MRSSLDLLTKPEKPIGHLGEARQRTRGENRESSSGSQGGTRETTRGDEEGTSGKREAELRARRLDIHQGLPPWPGQEAATKAKGPFTILEKKSDQVYVLQRRGVREQHTFNADRLIKVTGVEEAMARFPRDRWSPPDAGAPNPLLGPVEITSIDYSVIPPRYLVKSTRNGPATTQEGDEPVAHSAEEADTLGAIRAVTHKYLEKKNFLVLKEVEVPDSDLDQ
jgi:hypothetical protein